MTANRYLSSVITCLFVCAMPLVGVAGNDSMPTRHEGKIIEIVGVGPLAPELVERVCLHVEKHLKTSVKRLPAKELSGSTTLESEAPALESEVTDRTFALVALILADEYATKPYVQIRPEFRTALINARGLTPSEDDPEQYAQRLEKEAIAAVAALAGLSPNPMPYCATFRYSTDAELDAKGRNLCPPQWIKFKQLAAEAGLDGHTAETAAAPEERGAPGQP